MSTSPFTPKMTSRRKPASSQLTWGQMLTLEVLSGLCLLAILMVVALTGYRSAIAKARLSEVITGFASDRVALQEQMALTEEGLTLQGTAARFSDTTPAGEGKVPGKEHHSRELEYAVTQLENSLVARGTLGEARIPFFISYSPAVIANGTPGSMMWLCGNRKPPAGWARLPGPAGTDLPAEYLPSVCREKK